MRRFLAGGLVAGLTVMTMALAAAPVAQARPDAQSTSCNLKVVVRFDPGLNGSQQTQAIKARGKLTACNGGGVTGAALRGKGAGDLSCTSGIGAVTLKVGWNTGETSKVKLSVDLGNQTLSGTIVSGKFAGEDVTVSNVTFTILEGDCFFTPITKARVTGTAGL